MIDRIDTLGHDELCVTIRAQQVRALELAYRYSKDGVSGDIAVIGGGIGGLTLAAGIVLLCDRISSVTVFEAHNCLRLQLNRGNKWIHPTIYDWPDYGSDLEQVRALLPVSSWNAGEQHEVAQQILDDCLRIAQIFPHRLELKEYCRVTQAAPLSDGVAVSWESGAQLHTRRFDRAILSIGFGVEHDSERSYWNPSIYLSGYDVAVKPLCIGICGNGDSALVEFIAAALLPRGHYELLRAFDSFVKDDTRQHLIDIEDEAWRSSDGEFDFPSAYARLSDIAEMRHRLTPALRPNVLLVCINRIDRKFLHKKATSILNRLLAWILCSLSDAMPRPFARHLEYRKEEVGPDGVEAFFRNNIDASKYTVRFFSRTGANRLDNERPFAGLLPQGQKKTHARPRTPTLSLPAQLAYLSKTESHSLLREQGTIEARVQAVAEAVGLRTRLTSRSITWVWSDHPDQAQFVTAAALGRLSSLKIRRIVCGHFVDKHTAVEALREVLAQSRQSNTLIYLDGLRCSAFIPDDAEGPIVASSPEPLNIFDRDHDWLSVNASCEPDEALRAIVSQLTRETQAIADVRVRLTDAAQHTREPAPEEIATVLAGLSLPSTIAWRLGVWNLGVENWEEQRFHVAERCRHESTPLSPAAAEHVFRVFLAHLPPSLGGSPDLLLLASRALPAMRLLIERGDTRIHESTWALLLLAVSRLRADLAIPGAAPQIKTKLVALIGDEGSRKRRRKLWTLVTAQTSGHEAGRILLEVAGDMYKHGEASANYGKENENYWQAYCRFKASLRLFDAAAKRMAGDHSVVAELLRFHRAACLERMGTRLSRYARKIKGDQLMFERARRHLELAAKLGSACVRDAQAIYGSNAITTARRLSMLGNAYSNAAPIARNDADAKRLLLKAAKSHELAFWEQRDGRRGFISAYNWACTLFKVAEMTLDIEDARIAEDAMAAAYERAKRIDDDNDRLALIRQGWLEAIELRQRLE